jgi:cell division septation protein DedD
VLNQLRLKGFTGSLRNPRSGDRDRLIRIWVGSFESMEAARPLEAQLKEAGFQTYVRRAD